MASERIWDIQEPRENVSSTHLVFQFSLKTQKLGCGEQRPTFFVYSILSKRNFERIIPKFGVCVLNSAWTSMFAAGFGACYWTCTVCWCYCDWPYCSGPFPPCGHVSALDWPAVRSHGWFPCWFLSVRFRVGSRQHVPMLVPRRSFSYWFPSVRSRAGSRGSPSFGLVSAAIQASGCPKLLSNFLVPLANTLNFDGW
jgi:hypothetical protein